MDIWVSSDHHLGHSNVLVHDNRPFSCIQEHDLAMVEKWNEVVKPKDIVYYLGDITFRAQASYINPLLKQLNGKIHLVLGNHDKLIRKGHCVERFESIQEYLMFNHNKKRYVLFHYPIEEWYGKHRKTIHLHGHTHRPVRVTAKNRVNVNVICWDYYPVSLEQIHEEL